jgi:hypothetical protein
MFLRFPVLLALLLPILGRAETPVAVVSSKATVSSALIAPLAIVEADGSVAWKQPVPAGTPHDLSVLANGNILIILDNHRVVELEAKTARELWATTRPR